MVSGSGSSSGWLGRVAVVLAAAIPGVSARAVDYPGTDPGRARVRVEGDRISVGNRVLSAAWQVSDGRLAFGGASERGGGVEEGIRPGAAFTLTLTDGRVIRASDLRVVDRPRLAVLKLRPGARRLVERFGGRQVAVSLASDDGKFRVVWTVQLRDGSNYLTQRLVLTAVGEDLAIREIAPIDVEAANAKVVGTVEGSPVAVGRMFVACEHPMSRNRVEAGRVRCTLARQPLGAGESLTAASVIGVVPEGQLRRGFLHYVERERAHPYRPFLHYNSWYDIAWGDRKFNEAESLEVIACFGRELIRRRAVGLDSFVFDDGWDDNQTLWQFHDGFPDGFTRLRRAAAGYDSAVGTWLSPFGGYGEPKRQRLRYSRGRGYEINRKGFSLAGRRYYARFRKICMEMIRAYGVNFFKFDGVGAGPNVSGAGEFVADVEALIRLVGELREAQPEVYVSATTGTWCSPYFLWYADSTWRNGNDMGLAGTGSRRQQWITYRDFMTYRNVVQRGPLYPLNSLMTQGIAFAQRGYPATMTRDVKDLTDEIRSFFGSGTGLQELYVTPQMLTDVQWDVLAEGARWSRANRDVLVDTHWVGGDPGKGEVYGFASWSPRKGILVLRNPGDERSKIALEIGSVFELPAGAPHRYRLTSPWPEAGASSGLVLGRGMRHTFALDAYEVRVYDADPLPY